MHVSVCVYVCTCIYWEIWPWVVFHSDLIIFQCYEPVIELAISQPVCLFFYLYCSNILQILFLLLFYTLEQIHYIISTESNSQNSVTHSNLKNKKRREKWHVHPPITPPKM